MCERNKYSGKYVISPIDNKQYCRKNGEFFRHLRSYGYQDYQMFFDEYCSDEIRYCNCGNKCSFDCRRMEYKRSCGIRRCVGLITSNVKQNKTEFEKLQTSIKHQIARANQSEHIKQELIQRRRNTGNTIGDDGLTSYQRSVDKRRQTCLERYNDPTYNNSQQISQTKLNWTIEQKQQFLFNLKKSFNGGWMSDYFTEDQWTKRRKRWEQQGKAVPLDMLTEWEQYKKQARVMTERTYRNNMDIINPHQYPRTLAGTNSGYHLDHIIPICRGFVDNIPLDISSSVTNLQMLPWLDNVTKERIYAVERHQSKNIDP